MNQKKLLKPIKNMPEQWRQYKDTYFYVSDQGRVSHHCKNGKIFECGFSKSSGNSNSMVVKVNQKCVQISIMVYQTFKGEIPEGYRVVHKNGLYRDNSIYNLELVKISDCGKRFGHMSKSQKVYCKETNKVYRSARAAKVLPVTAQTICYICNGEIKKPCMNFYWYEKANNRIYRGKYTRILGE